MNIKLSTRHLLVIFITLFSQFILLSNANSCTTVFANDKGDTLVVARTMDLYISDQPLLFVEPRGVKRNGEAGANSLTWTAKYGSVVITAFHSYAASDGINEKGLVAHLLYLSKSEYPKNSPGAVQISNLMWARYALDNYATVKEALAGMKDLKIIPTIVQDKTWPIHFALEDATGDSAVVEYIDGKIHIYHGAEYRVMTNEPPFNIQLANLKNYQGFGGKKSLPGDSDPLSRFVRVATYLKTLPSANDALTATADVLSVIRTAMVPFGAVDTSGNVTEDAWPTRWLSVADITNKIYYFNSTMAPNIIWVDLNKLNFKEGAERMMIDPADINLGGDVSGRLVKCE